MQTRARVCAVILLLVQFSGAKAQKATPQIRESELRETPVTVGPFRITIAEFKGPSFSVPFSHIKMLVENTSGSFALFSPNKLLFVGHDGAQADVFGTFYSYEGGRRAGYLPPVDRDFAPNSHTTLFYILTGEVEIPARLFYDRQIIAEIVK